MSSKRHKVEVTYEAGERPRFIQKIIDEKKSINIKNGVKFMVDESEVDDEDWKPVVVSYTKDEGLESDDQGATTHVKPSGETLNLKNIDMDERRIEITTENLIGKTDWHTNYKENKTQSNRSKNRLSFADDID